MRARGLLLGTVIAAALATGPASALPGDRPDGLDLPGAPKRKPEFLAQVNSAIDLGVKWLRTQQGADGSFTVGSMERWQAGGPNGLGPTALGVYTLRACGVGPTDPAAIRGIQWLRERWESGRRQRQDTFETYGVSLTILALEAHFRGGTGPETDKDRYGKSVEPGVRIPEPDLAWLRQLTAWLVEAQTKSAQNRRDGGFSYVSPARGLVHDHSNTQYALLALKAARRCGVAVPEEVWRRSLEHFLEEQEKPEGAPLVARYRQTGVEEDGYGTRATRAVAKDHARGWGYFDRSPATGSMTAGGVSSVVICRSELAGTKGYPEALDRRAEQAIWDGLAWLGHHFSVKANPGPPGAPMMREQWHYYYLYGLERAGVLAGVAWMARHDWYLEGAVYLLEEQKDGGTWLARPAFDPKNPPFPGMGPDAPTSTYLDTCFALLFLRRATFRVARGTVTQGAEAMLDLSGAAALEDRDFADLFGAVLRRYAAADESRREALSADFVRMGRRAIPLLVLGLEDEDPARRAAAADVLWRTTGETRGFDPAGDPSARAAAVARWEEWWVSRRETLEGDAATGRFVETKAAGGAR